MAAKTESIIDAATVAKFLPKKDSVAGKVKVKKPAAKPKQEAEDNPPSSPLLNSIDAALRATFESGRPMDDPANLIQCKHCKKPMLQSVAHAHIKVCLKKKNEKAQKKKEQKEANRKAREALQKAERERETQEGDSDDESVAGDKKGANGTSKKRKADGEGEKAPNKKKTKKELEAAKPKVTKQKGPVDVERQCGVLLPNGAMCARSLTCKSHSMGAKRAVPGRSQRYDLLLAAYQKKNQAKQQKAALDANAPLLDDIAENQGPIDSDEERDLVMAAVARSRPKPLEQHVFVPIRRKYNYLRVKDMLSTALSGGRGNVFGGAAGAAAAAAAGGYGAVPPLSAGGATDLDSMAPPTSARSVGSGVGGLPTPTRKASVASVGSATMVN